MINPTLVRIELGPLRTALEHFARADCMEHIGDEQQEQISSLFRVALMGLSPEQCAGVYAAMLLAALPTADG